MTTPTFSTALAQVADIQQPLKTLDVNGLSNARRPDVQLFTETWPGISVERRREIMKRMGELIAESFEVEFTPLNRVALKDADDEVRATAINNLWESEDEDLIDPYLKFLTEDRSVLVRAAAAGALGKYMFLAEMEELEEDVAATVRQALLATIRRPTEDLTVRCRAVESIGFLSDDEVRSVVEDAYNSSSEKMQASALFAMGRSLDQYWSGTVIMEIHNVNPEVRLEAVRASGELELKQAAPLLVDLLEDPNRTVLLEAIYALGQIGGPIAQRALELMVDSEDEEIAQQAEDALAELQFGSGDDWLVYDLNANAADDDFGDFELEEGDEINLDDDFDILWKNRDRKFDD